MQYIMWMMLLNFELTIDSFCKIVNSGRKDVFSGSGHSVAIPVRESILTVDAFFVVTCNKIESAKVCAHRQFERLFNFCVKHTLYNYIYTLNMKSSNVVNRTPSRENK